MTNETIYVSEGMSAVLKCQVDLNSTVSWNGPNGNYGSIKYAEGPDINPYLYYEGQLKIVGNILNGEYFMKITNVSKREDGLYTCFQINYKKMTARETFVTLIVQCMYIHIEQWSLTNLLSM